MRNSPTSTAANQQETCVRARDDPFFDGMRRGDATMINKGRNATSNVKFQGEIGRTVSDVGSRRSRKTVGQVIENPLYNVSPKASTVDVLVPSYGKSSSARWLRMPATSLSPLSDTQSELKFEVKDNDSHKESPRVYVANEDCKTLLCLANPALEKSYSINKGRTYLSKVPLPPSAASFYNGHSPHIEVVESCESIYRLNMYLKVRKDDVSAGVPGKFLHAVIGPDICDVGSVVSTIMYAFYLSEWLKNSQFCTVPVINMKRSEISSHAELKWLFDSCHIDQSSLVFIDEIDLSYYEIFGSLKLVLLNCNQLPAKQEALKESLVEIVCSGKHGNTDAYSWVENVTLAEELSCCTLIAEKFLLSSPKTLSGQGFARLLLSGILLDTANFGIPHTTSKDKYMATLLINGAGRYGCNGLYELLRSEMYDVADKLGYILRKDFKKWTRMGKVDGTNSRMMVSNIGMSSIGLPITQLLSLDSNSTMEINHFQRLEKLSVLAIVSGYFDSEKNFKREILFSAESSELLRKLILFIKSTATDLPLKFLHSPDLRGQMKIFEINKITSRKTIERLMEEYVELAK